MHVPGVEQILVPVWNAWVLRGGRPEAEPIPQGEGWQLRLSWRMKLGSWLFLGMFSACLAGTVLLQQVDPQPPRMFWLMFGFFALLTAMGVYYYLFCRLYRVELNDHELILKRFLLPTRRIAWHDVARFQLSPDFETLAFESDAGLRVAIYCSLNGLSAVRRCLAAFAELSRIMDSWSATDPVLMQFVPAWRCAQGDLEDDPFTPLGTWQHAAEDD